MSYRNPKVYAPDPTAFAKSFMGSFQSTMQGFEAEKEKKKQQQEKDDLIEAEYLRYSNIGDLEGVSESVNSALQDSINSMVDSKTFVNMSAVERQRVLNDIANIKAGSQSLVELLSIDPSEISNRSKRSNPELHAILSQMRLDPSKIKISGDPTNPDVKFSYTDENGNINTTSLRDLRRYKNTYISRVDDENNFNKGFDNFIEGTQKLIKEDANKGKATKTSILDNFLIKGYDENNNRIYNEKALSNDEKAYIWYEMMEDKDKENLKTFDLYPKGQKPEDRKTQDQAIYDYYYNMANQKLIQPAIRDTSGNGKDINVDQTFKNISNYTNQDYSKISPKKISNLWENKLLGGNKILSARKISGQDPQEETNMLEFKVARGQSGLETLIFDLNSIAQKKELNKLLILGSGYGQASREALLRLNDSTNAIDFSNLEIVQYDGSN